MKKDFLSAFLILIISTLQLTAQEVKLEKEDYVDRTAFPESALHQLDELPETRRMKYIKQVDGNDVTYEAKFVLKGQKLSVEFSPNGSLEDIEVLMKKRNLPKTFLTRLDKNFKGLFKKYKITRVQKQYKPGPGLTENPLLLYLENAMANFDINYELEVRLVEKNGNKIGHYEYLLNENAQIKQKREIINVIDDNEVY